MMVAEQMQQVGSNLLFVIPGELEASSSTMKSNFLRSANVSTLTLGDAEAILDATNVPDVRDVAPEFIGSGTAVYGNRIRNGSEVAATRRRSVRS